MGNLFSRVVDKIRFHYEYRCIVNQWVVGITRGNMGDIIRSKSFNPDIRWIALNSAGHQQADPFILEVKNGKVELLVEDFRVDDDYAKIAHAKFDRDFGPEGHEIILDTGSHLSYHHIFRENGKTYVLPEAGKSGKLSLYEFDISEKELKFVIDLLHIPLLDANIVKKDNRYWIFGVVRSAPPADSFELLAFYADSLAGPYQAHVSNPLQKGLDAVRGAGNFFEVDNVLYRPAQNCRETYGKSITVSKVEELNTTTCRLSPYMTVTIDRSHPNNRDIHTLHTLNGENGIIVVDGIRKRFSPLVRMKEIRKEKKG
jgi:hypothetical protein